MICPGTHDPSSMLSCAEMLQQVADVGAALTAAGLCRGGKIAIFSVSTLSASKPLLAFHSLTSTAMCSADDHSVLSTCALLRRDATAGCRCRGNPHNPGLCRRGQVATILLVMPTCFISINLSVAITVVFNCSCKVSQDVLCRDATAGGRCRGSPHSSRAAKRLQGGHLLSQHSPGIRTILAPSSLMCTAACSVHVHDARCDVLCCAETLQQVADVGAALTAAGLRRGGKVAIFSVNTPQWMITMQARPTRC